MRRSIRIGGGAALLLALAACGGGGGDDTGGGLTFQDRFGAAFAVFDGTGGAADDMAAGGVPGPVDTTAEAVALDGSSVIGLDILSDPQAL